MKEIDLAIIIPTLNEENYIGHLLDSIATQTVMPKELVVVDAKSTDLTVKEIQKRKKTLPQLRVYVIDKSSISKQRNLGVSKTVSPHILFLDADMVLKNPLTLEKYISEIERKKPDLAAASNVPLSWYWKDVVYFLAANILMKNIISFFPVVAGMNLYVKRSVFKSLNGFDEDIRIGEDMEFVQRAKKRGFRFSFLDSTIMYTSPRRLHKEGRRKYGKKMFRAYLHVRKHGYRNNPIEYEFGNFSNV